MNYCTETLERKSICFRHFPTMSSTVEDQHSEENEPEPPPPVLKEVTNKSKRIRPAVPVPFGRNRDRCD